MLFGLFSRRNRHEAPASALYDAIVAAAREQVFYRDLGVPDTVEGRFEMVALHLFLLLHRLKDTPDAGEAQALGQAVFDLAFADMDRNLRELGVGDLGVGRRVKAMAKSFYGRVKAYEGGLEGTSGTLGEAIERNLLDGAGTGAAAAAIAEYARHSVAVLGGQIFADLLRGELRFAEPPRAASPAPPEAAEAAEASGEMP